MNQYHEDLETPQIVVEPPLEEDVIDSQHLHGLPGVGGHEGAGIPYPEVASSLNNPFPYELGIFSNTVDQSVGQVTPLITQGLRDGGFSSDFDQLYTQRCGTVSSGNLFLSPSQHSPHSPVDGAWSPASESSGDAFPDYASDDGSSGWSPSVSSPSSPSLSPINQSMNNIALSDGASDDGTSFSPISIPRHRSNSHTGFPEFSAEQAAGRPRSASFTDGLSLESEQSYYPPQLSGQFMPQQTQNNTYLVPDPEMFNFNAFSSNFGVAPSSPSWDSPDSSSQQSSPSFPPQPHLQLAPHQSAYSPPAVSPPGHSRSQSQHLTVPNLSRRGAQHHKRHHSHTGIQDRGRGAGSRVRSRHGSPSHSLSRSPSRTREDDASSLSGFSPYLQLDTNLSEQQLFVEQHGLPHHTPPSSASVSLSPSISRSQSPTSPASSVDINVPPSYDTSVPVINVNDFDSFNTFDRLDQGGNVRRHFSYTGPGSRSASPSRAGGSSSDHEEGGAHLQRVSSDPLGGRRQFPRKQRAPNTVLKYPGLLKPAGEVDDEETYINMKRMEGTLNITGAGGIDPGMMGGDLSVLRGVGMTPEGGYKETVGSDKILKASGDRRKNDAKFKCPICGNSFTAKHNLTNHLNSHNGIRPYDCKACGASFTTKGTFQRHATKCRNKATGDEGKLARKRS